MAMFAKRHHEAIAATMRKAHPGAALSADNRAVIQWSETVKDLAETFRQDNAAFDNIRFVKACRPVCRDPVRALTARTQPHHAGNVET